MERKRIDIEDRHLDILKKILSPAHIDFYAYGSRVKGNNSKYSDLDICFKGDLSKSIHLKILAELEESDLPYKIDLSDYSGFSDDFKQMIEADLIKLF